MALLATMGFAVAGYLFWVHISGELALCIGSSGCEQVQASRFATVHGVPVAALGLMLWTTLMVLTVLWLRGSYEPRIMALSVFGLSLAGLVYSAYLTYAELFVIHAICPWCVSSAVLMGAYWGTSGWELVSRLPGPGRHARRRAKNARH